MVSRLMFNLRRPSELSNATVTTTAAGSIPTLTLLSDAPMNNEEAEEDAVREFLNRRNGSFCDVIACELDEGDLSDHRYRDGSDPPKGGHPSAWRMIHDGWTLPLHN